MCSPSTGLAGFAPRRCSPRSPRRSCDRCAWGYRRRVFPRGHCDGIPAAFDWRWAVTSFSFVGLLISLAELLSFPRRAPVSTGNIPSTRCRTPSGRFAFNTSLGHGRCPLDSRQALPPCTRLKDRKPCFGRHGFLLWCAWGCVWVHKIRRGTETIWACGARVHHGASTAEAVQRAVEIVVVRRVRLNG